MTARETALIGADIHDGLTLHKGAALMARADGCFIGRCANGMCHTAP